ncbi:hypothetical protein AB0F17_28650 [Nonomuraea sp. NPDC026600]|uniref:hypothetical protein n=1 Tax=Nonomuraea sp. NPDC026600 TaxID=3155363 RepID=UPI0033E4A46E
MAISGTDHMASNKATTTARRISARPDLWVISDRPGLYTGNQATTAMVLAEIKARHTPLPNDAALIASYEQELLVPPMPVDPWALLQTLRDAARAASSLTETEEFEVAPFGGDVAEIHARTAETVEYLASLGDRCSEIAGEMAEGVTLGAGGQVEFEPDSTPAHVAWARSASASLTAAELLSRAAELLHTAQREAAQAQRLGRERAGG